VSALVTEIKDLLEKGINANYDMEAVSQLEHALQCATLAEAAGSDKSLVLACLLHDLGHLIHYFKPELALGAEDRKHEILAANYMAGKFDPAVVEPIRLHVEAKRYLCHVDSGYWETLSDASKFSLEFQGGPYDAEQSEAFIQLPYAREAVQLRLWDEQAKVPGLATPQLSHFAGLLDEFILIFQKN
jgi:phosphonate degradation associated HDIG domain protein